jgi:hypothetical protein
MSSATTAHPDGGLGTAGAGRSLLRGATTGGIIATLVNAALWAGGRAAGVSFEVPGSLVAEVDLISVVLTTAVMFAIGSGLLALAARRGRHWVRALLAVAGVVAVASATAPLATAAATATGVLLATMHLVTGTVFVVTASRMLKA